MPGEPVIPLPREDGYWLDEDGVPRFVPFVKVPAPGEVLPAVEPEPDAPQAQVLFFSGERREPPVDDWYFGAVS